MNKKQSALKVDSRLEYYDNPQFFQPLESSGKGYKGTAPEVLS